MTCAILLVCAPILALCVELVSGSTALSIQHIWPGRRGSMLLFESLVFSVFTTLTGAVIAISAASLLADISGCLGGLCRLLAIAPIAVPTYLHALSWQHLVERFGLSGQGATIAFLIETVSRLPLLVAACLIGLATVDPLARKAALVHTNAVKTFLFVSLPQARPVIIAGACISLIFSLNEYALPALFQRHTYALEVFVEYSFSGNSVDTFLKALPLMLLTTVAAILAINFMIKLPSVFSLEKTCSRSFTGPAFYDSIRLAALFLVFCPLLIPIWKALTIISADTSIPLTASSYESLFHSTMVALSATLFALPFAWLLAEQLHQRKSRTVWILLILSLSMPASLIGTGTIKFWLGTGMDELYNGWGVAVAGMAVRLVPLATLLLYTVIRNSDPLPWEAARMFRSGIGLWVKIRLFQIWPGILGAFLLCFALSLPDLELSLLLLPPGSTGIGVRIFNYLHYGASEQVAYLSSVLLMLMLLSGGSVYYLVSRFAILFPDNGFRTRRI